MLKGMPSIPVCVAYQYGGELLETLLSSSGTIEQPHPVYRQFPAFNASERCRSFSELSAAARKLVDFVDERVAPVRWVCIGKRRDQMLKRRRMAPALLQPLRAGDLLNWEA